MLILLHVNTKVHKSRRLSFIYLTFTLGQSCTVTVRQRSSCWRVRGARSRCWTSCRVCITAWIQNPGVTRPLCWPACAPSSGRSKRRLCGWSLTCGRARKGNRRKTQSIYVNNVNFLKGFLFTGSFKKKHINIKRINKLYKKTFCKHEYVSVILYE